MRFPAWMVPAQIQKADTRAHQEPPVSSSPPCSQGCECLWPTRLSHCQGQSQDRVQDR